MTWWLIWVVYLPVTILAQTQLLVLGRPFVLVRTERWLNAQVRNAVMHHRQRVICFQAIGL